MNKLRYALIGVGAQVYARHHLALTLPNIEVVAVADTRSEIGRQRANELQCHFYEDYRLLLAEEHPDVVVILTPSFLHASIALDCLEAHCHILVEKPLALQISDADRLITLAKRKNLFLRCIYQHRFRPEIERAAGVLQAGELGTLRRVQISASWPRSHEYYSLAWRGTWQGKGGGVILNQAPHYLDLLSFLYEQPCCVFAWTQKQLHTNIETEDTVQASFLWSNGMLGSLFATTAEAGRQESIQTFGSRGHMKICEGQLSISYYDLENDQDLSTSPVAVRTISVDFLPKKDDHWALYQEFNAALLYGSPLRGDEGRRSLELANALIYSSHRHQSIELPLDGQTYTAFLHQEIDQSPLTSEART